MMVAKILLISVISTKGAKFMMIDISNFYLMTPIKRPEYIHMHIRGIPDKIIAEYTLKEKADANGALYIVANRGMYGFPQSGLLANELPEKRLNKRGYHKIKLVPGIWKHKWRPVQFTLVVDYFGVRYVRGKHALQLKQTLKENYTVTTEWDSTRYIGITLDWDYKQKQVHVSLPGYTKKSIKQFSHKQKKQENQPYPRVPIKYGSKKHISTQPSSAPLLEKKERNLFNKCAEMFF